MSDYAGIDYGMGQTNIDTRTGVRYGVISQNAVAHRLFNELEPICIPYCPHCVEELSEEFCDTPCDCPFCGEEIGDGDQYADEPHGWEYSRDGYELSLDSYGDLWVFKSPYVTRVAYCSPCAPGAGHLETPCDNGPLTYCLGPDWFDDDSPCPYAPLRIEDVLKAAQ